MRDTLVNLDYEDDWEEFIEACEQMQAQHDSGNCGDECIYCDEYGPRNDWTPSEGQT